MKVLIVEDAPSEMEHAVFSLKRICKNLNIENVEIVKADNYTDAMSHILGSNYSEKGNQYVEPNQGSFDLVLTDIYMPLGDTYVGHSQLISRSIQEYNKVQAFGSLIALSAVMNKIPKVGIVTSGDGNHHGDAHSASISILRRTISWIEDSSNISLYCPESYNHPDPERLGDHKEWSKSIEKLLINSP